MTEVTEKPIYFTPRKGTKELEQAVFSLFSAGIALSAFDAYEKLDAKNNSLLRSRIKRTLKNLADSGAITKTGNKRGTKYQAVVK